MTEHLKLLGFKVRDVVTGFEGTVETVAYDLYGCIQAIVKPPISQEKPTEIPDGRWFDMKRLRAISSEPVMAVPTFAVIPGGSEKPSQPSQPMK